jgi:hypothetical protein
MSTDNAELVKQLDLQLASALARMDEAAAGKWATTLFGRT